MFGLASVLMQC